VDGTPYWPDEAAPVGAPKVLRERDRQDEAAGRGKGLYTQIIQMSLLGLVGSNGTVVMRSQDRLDTEPSF
jgi:hypothetical protein